jgi:hypothetical protein
MFVFCNLMTSFTTLYMFLFSKHVIITYTSSRWLSDDGVGNKVIQRFKNRLDFLQSSMKIILLPLQKSA